MKSHGFDKSEQEVAALDVQIRELFGMYDVTNLRINNHFVEFNYQNVNDRRAGNEIDFSILQKLHKLLKPKKMQINGWTDVDGCAKCKVAEDYGYVVLYLT